MNEAGGLTWSGVVDVFEDVRVSRALRGRYHKDTFAWEAHFEAGSVYQHLSHGSKRPDALRRRPRIQEDDRAQDLKLQNLPRSWRGFRRRRMDSISALMLIMGAMSSRQ